MKAEKFLTALLLATGAAVYATFTDGGGGSVTPIELSGFAAGLLKAALAVGLFWAFDRYVLDEVDTVAELKAGNVAYALALLALAVLLAATVATAQTPTVTGQARASGVPSCQCTCACVAPEVVPPEVVPPAAETPGDLRPRLVYLDTALAYVGTVERGENNRGPQVERFLQSVGLGPGNPWCAAYVSYVLEAAGVRAPLDGQRRVIRSGLAARFITARSIRASEALRGIKRVPPGAIVVWRRGYGPFGHAGFAVAWDGASGETVEGNTSPGRAGRQRDGEGVWRRQRRITPGSYFRIVSFTPVDAAHWR